MDNAACALTIDKFYYEILNIRLQMDVFISTYYCRSKLIAPLWQLVFNVTNKFETYGPGGRVEECANIFTIADSLRKNNVNVEDGVHKIFQSIVQNRGKLQNVTIRFVKIIEKILQSRRVNKVECIQELMMFKQDDLINLRKLTNLVKCNYLLLLERLIMVTQLCDCHRLINLHQSLAEELKVKDIYENLFPRITGIKVSEYCNRLPIVLIKIIVEYCEIYWDCALDSGDVGEMFEKINKL